MSKRSNGVQVWTVAQKRTQLDVLLVGDARWRLAIGMDREK